MHETMIAQSLLEAILAESAKQKAKPVSATVICGAFDAINDEVLCFAFEAVANDTPCSDMKLNIEHKLIKGQCKNCNEVFEFQLSSPKCPKCGGDCELLPDEPLTLQEIEFESE